MNPREGEKNEYLRYVLNYDQSKLPEHKAKIFEEPKLVELGKSINAGSGLFSRVLFIENNYYVFLSKPGGIYTVREYNQYWEFTGLEKRLTPEGESDVDEDIAFDGNYIYEYCMVRPGPGGKIRKFDKSFNLIKQTPVFSGEPNDVILDQNIAIVNGKVYAGSEFRNNSNLWKMGGNQNIPPNNKVSRGTHLRIFDKDLNLLEEKDLVANIKGAVVPNQYWGLGAGQLYTDRYYCVIASSSIGNISYFNQGESIGARQIFIIRFNENFNFLESKGPLSDTSNDNFWPTGIWYEDELYYVSYTFRRPGEGSIMGPPGPGEGNIRLSIFDSNFNEMESIDITKIGVNQIDASGAHRSKIFKKGNLLFIAYDKDGHAFIQELVLK